MVTIAHSSGFSSRWHAARHGRATARFGSTADAPPMLERRERVLVAATPGSGRTIGTDRALIFRDVDACWRRIAWPDIAEAEWARGAAVLTVRLWPDGKGAARYASVSADHRVAALVADQIRSSQVLRRRVQLTDTASATIVATRVPGEDTVTWRVYLDPNSASDRTTALAAEQALAELRRLAGC